MSIIHMYVLKLLFHSTTLTVSYEYNTAFSLFFVVFFKFARLSASRERNHSTWGRQGEKKREEKEKEVGFADSAWYVSRFYPSLADDWVCLFCLQAVLSSGVDRGGGEREGGCKDKGRGVGRVKRSRVSPGSLCRSLVPAVHSCSSSSLSAGCTAARWCLWWKEKNVMDVRQKGWNKKKSHIFASINAISFDNAVTFKLLSCQYIKSTAMTLVMTQLKCGPGFLKCNLFSFHFIFHWRFRKERVISLGQKPTVWQSVTIQTKHIQRRKKKISWCSVVKTCRGNYLHTHILPDIKNRACSTFVYLIREQMKSLVEHVASCSVTFPPLWLPTLQLWYIACQWSHATPLLEKCINAPTKAGEKTTSKYGCKQRAFQVISTNVLWWWESIQHIIRSQGYTQCAF